MTASGTTARYDRLDADVIVVGAGPVGLMLAGELRLGGADVLLLERLPRPTTESRASTLHARTMEVLDQRGLLDDLGTLPNEVRGHFGGLPLDFGDSPTRFPGLWKLPQTHLEALLAAWTTRLGARLRRGYEVRGLTEASEYVEVEAAGPDGPARFRAAYLVGCDGEQSIVRRLGGFAFSGNDALRELIRADVTGIDIPDRRFQRLPRGLAIAATRGGVTRIMMHEFGRPGTTRASAPEFAEVARVWQRITGDNITDGQPLWINSFGDASRQVSAYRKGRMLLAGDAAHLQMPVGGQALNLGLQDAVNLGWKLAGQVRGWAPEALLDSYHRERHAIGSRTLTNIRAQSELLLGGAEVEPLRAIIGDLLAHRAARCHLATMIAGLDVSYPISGRHPMLGSRLPCRDVVTDAGRTSTTAMLRPATGLLIDVRPPHRQKRWSASARSWPEWVRVVRAKADGDEVLPGVSMLLLRPDGHVAWVDDGTEPIEKALDQWFRPSQPSDRQ
ncbi:FAD-dependent monooxygenase [Salinispora fenicalii]|uniref:FAD-dependent monooxygenase n=1 Tax=Salinispora fenicalii TaxID=1137263 RepID=UPI00048A2A9A|nr:FAD-dependent monooxygenase [Salinispora fenicalii]